MHGNRVLFSGLLALTATLSACSDKESPAATAPSPAASPSMSANCDMQGMDMSKMSAEEHQKMMEDCERAKSGSGGGY